MREVVAATRLGQKNLARDLLRQLQEQDPNNEQALLWSAALAETPEEATAHLERVLEINPNNQQAINVLAMHRLNPQASRPRVPMPLRPEPAAPPPEVSSPRPARFERESPVTLHRPSSDAFSQPPAEAWRRQPVPGAPPESRPFATPPPVEPPSTPKLPASPTASRVVSFHELLKRGWNCPLCEVAAPHVQRRCARCGALMALDDLTALAENRGADEKLLLQALEVWTRKTTGDPTFEGWLNLARVYFNLNRSAEALPCLNKACDLRPSEVGLRQVAERLQQRRLVLAVDDSMTLRRILAIMLERHGYRVLTAADGMQALAMLNEQVPDLILLDITMPRMDGYQTCKVIKQNPYTKPIPVVMLSGNDGFFDKVKGRLAGATDYITKPFEEKALADAVQKHLRVSQKSGR
jgi:twitching motility two-component system response regulator PilG